tara:strand:- start:150 stop:905 length:756 start_codon:yes stop_codon:yes gene_type:complete
MSKVTIILPTYNCEKYIEETLNSIIEQSFEDWKLIIVDDASKDNSIIIIKKFLSDERITLKKLKKNKGAGFCRNFALRESFSKYIAFIDSDDIWNKDKLKKQIHFMETNNLDFTYTNYTPFKVKKGIKKFQREIKPPEKLTYNLFTKKTSICTSSMMVKREQIGLTKFINTKICEDYFFKCKLLKKCNSVRNFNETMTYYRISKNSLQSKKLRNFYWVWYINKRYNKMNFINNILSLFFISINSIKNYGFK